MSKDLVEVAEQVRRNIIIADGDCNNLVHTAEMRIREEK